MRLNRILFLAFFFALLSFLAIRYYPKSVLSLKAPERSDLTLATSPSSTATSAENQPSQKTETGVSSQLTLPEREQLKVLEDIFQSKNDNDPRMDQVLVNLSEPVKEALRKRYQELKPELRNERGTIAFLVGREVREGRGTPIDVEFLKSILLEKPCMSLADCSRVETGQSSEEEHLQGIYETTANYPQLMDLRYLKQSLQSERLSNELRESVIRALESALHSPNPVVVLEAKKILESVR